MDLERLTPAGSPGSPDLVASGLRLDERARADRPYVVINMVASVDGRATIAGRAGPLGNEADRQLFHQLRTQVDAVMVGARTAAVERYGRLVRDPELRDKRRREGLSADPLAVIVSGRLRLPVDVPLLQDESSEIVVVTGANGELAETRAHVDYLRAGGDHVALGAALRRLREDHGVRSVLCEGGPTLNAALLADGLVDELFLSLAPKLTAGPDPITIVRGPALPEVVDMELVWALRAGSDLFLRYRL